MAISLARKPPHPWREYLILRPTLNWLALILDWLSQYFPSPGLFPNIAWRLMSKCRLPQQHGQCQRLPMRHWSLLELLLESLEWMKLMEHFLRLEQPRYLSYWMDLSRLVIARGKLG